jgi:PAS domain S-box-containing protein
MERRSQHIPPLHADILRPSEGKELLQQIFFSTDDAILVMNATTGEFLDANPSACAMFGYSQQELRSRAPNRIFPWMEGTLDKFHSKGKKSLYGVGCRLKSGPVIPCDISVWSVQIRGEMCLLVAIREAGHNKLSETVQKDAAFARLSSGVAVAAAAARTIEDSLRFAVQQICDYVPWAFGHARVVAQRILDAEVDVWHFGLSPRWESREKAAISRLAAASKAWHSPVAITGRSFVIDLETESDPNRRCASRDLGLRCALVAPILLREEVIGVLEFFSKKPIRASELFLEILGDLAAKLGHIIEVKGAENNSRKLSAELLHVQDEERRRLGKELHDTTAQNVAMMIMDLAVISQNAEALAPKARMALSECVSLAQQSLRELRTLSYQLHPPMLDELGLLPALRIYVEGFSKRSGMQVQTELPNIQLQLPRELETAVFHVVQEGLTNAQRHSASPWAKIGLSVSPAGLRISVENVATGTPQLKNDAVKLGTSGVGMRSMRERVRHFGGQLALHSDQNRTVLEVILPLSPAALDRFLSNSAAGSLSPCQPRRKEKENPPTRFP